MEPVMRILVIAAVLVVGCSTTYNPTDARLTKFRQESQAISERERQCIRATVIQSNDQIAQIAATHDPNADTELLTQMVTNDRDRELSECKAAAQREEEQLAARERAEYANQAKDESERNALMMILTTSQFLIVFATASLALLGCNRTSHESGVYPVTYYPSSLPNVIPTDQYGQSVTVDPEHDRPSRLFDYARAFNANVKGSFFLTGSPVQIDELMRGFRLGRSRESDWEIDHILARIFPGRP
jgi:hypothetical protein